MYDRRVSGRRGGAGPGSPATGTRARHPGVPGTLWLAAGLAAAVCLVELAARLDHAAAARAVASS